MQAYLNSVLLVEPTYTAQFSAAFIQFTIWSTLFHLLTPPLVNWIKSRPWCRTMVKIEHHKNKNFGDKKTDENCIQSYAYFILVVLQHGICSILSLPAVFGWSNFFISPVILVRYGALGEVGWEYYDFIYQVKKYLSDPNRNPATLILITLHHTMGQLLVFPMNIYFSENWEYAAMVLNLQGAAFLG